MDCTRARESISAAIDGEDSASAARPVIEAHLHDCAACRRWVEDVEHIDRLVRLAPAPDLEPDLVPGVLACIRLPRFGRRIRALRAALCVTAIVQVAIGLAGFADTIGMSTHGMSMPAHMSHELVAFNIAFGVALLIVAVRVDRARSQVPTLTAFVAVLGVVSVLDLAAGEVELARLATHIPIVVGLLLSACVAQIPAAFVGPDGPTSANGGRLASRLTAQAWRWQMGSPPPSPAAVEREERRVA